MHLSTENSAGYLQRVQIFLKPFIGEIFNYKKHPRLISVVDVVITPMNPYQPIPFHILSFAVFQSRILIYAGSNIYMNTDFISLEASDLSEFFSNGH